MVTGISTFTGMSFVESMSPSDKIFTVLPESEKLTIPPVSTHTVTFYRFYSVGKFTFGTALVLIISTASYLRNFSVDNDAECWNSYFGSITETEQKEEAMRKDPLLYETLLEQETSDKNWKEKSMWYQLKFLLWVKLRGRIISKVLCHQT